MADRSPLSDAALDQALRSLAVAFPYPPTPDLASAIRARLGARPAGRRWWSLPPARRTALALAAAVLLIVSAAAALVPDVRSAVAHFFHVRGVVISSVPSALPSLSPGPLELGQRMTLEQAQGRVSFQILSPTLAALGSPDSVFYDSRPPGGEVNLLYTARPGMPTAPETGVAVLITEFRGDINPGLFQKVVGGGTRVKEVVVNGGPGYWIEGSPHEIFLEDANGNFLSESLRLAANTLIFEDGKVTVRIESALSQADATRIAGSFR